MSYKDELMKLRKSMYEVIHSRNDLIDRLVKHETYDAYPLSVSEEKQGYIINYAGMPLQDEKQILLKEISVLTSWIEYQKVRVEDAITMVELFESGETKEVA